MSRQWRSDDTAKWLYGFGTGVDGNLTISSNTTETPIDASCSGTSGATSLAATNASFAAGQFILIHQTRGTGAGSWELNKIASYVAGTITLQHTLENTYTDSGASQAQVRVLKQYNHVNINSGITYTAKAWDGDVGGILGFFAKGNVTVTGSIDNKGASVAFGDSSANSGGGFRGTNSAQSSGTANQGEGYSDLGVAANAANGNGGGGGGAGGSYYAGGGGGNGTAGVNGTNNGVGGNGVGGETGGNAELTSMIFGGGGGGAYGTAGGANPTAGANGGGIVLIIAKKIIISGSINVSGGSTGDGAAIVGGAGAGGSCLLKCQTATLGTTKITGTGGVGGNFSGSWKGGNGGVGRIHIDYSGSYTGTTTPTIDATKDGTIVPPEGGGFVLMMV